MPVLFDSVCMDPVIDLCQVTPDIPAELPVLFILEPLEFLDKIEFELHRDPRGEFIRDILMSVRAAIPSRFRN